MPTSYSFTPQFATIRSESPLAGMRPVVSVPQIQHTALEFRSMQPIKITSAQPELVTEGIAAGVVAGGKAALEGIKTAYLSKREKEEGLLKEEREHKRALELANVRAKGTPEEEEYQRKYRELSLQNIQSQIEQRGGNKKPSIQPVPAGKFKKTPTAPLEAVEVPLPSRSEPDFTIPEEALQGVSSLKEMTPPVVVTKPIVKPIPVPEDIFRTAGVGIPMETPGIARQQVPFEQLDYVPVSEGEAEQLIKQPAYTEKSLVIPGTPQEMADFATQQAAARLRELEDIDKIEATGVQPVSVTEEVNEPVGPDQYINIYESFEDALYANEQLGKLMPGYQTQEVVEEQLEDGSTVYRVKSPIRKAPGTSATGVPEGMKIKSAKTDETGKTVVEYEPEVPKEKQIEVLKQPVQSNETMLKAIQQIKSIYRGVSPATGLSGSIMQWIPASDAADVRQLIKALKGNIAFKALSDMRRASPTGAAVGSVTEKELDLLSSTMGAIDPAMSEFLFTENLNTIEKILTDYNNGVKQEIEALEKPQKFQSIQNNPKFQEGDTATNPQTGQKLKFNNGKWIPAK